MVNLKIYGKPSSTYEYMKDAVLSIAQKADIELDLEEIKEIQRFIDMDILSIPAYQFNGIVHERGEDTLIQFIRKLQLEILKKADYGSLKVINVPVDYSDSSENAVNYAIELSQKFNCVLRLIHVYHPSAELAGQTPELAELFAAQESQLKEYTKLVVQNCLEPNKNIIDTELKIGLAYDQIQLISEENPDNWIVMASTNSSKRIKNIFGSISISTAKNSKCPVFIVPPKTEFKPYKKIALCINDDDLTPVTKLIPIASAFGAEIHLLHVFNPQDIMESDEIRKELKTMYPNEKTKFCTLHGKDKIDTINNYCEKNEIDLLVLSRHKKGILSELLHKSFTKQILLNTELPILVLHK